ncbi:hypothetical protein EV421DRAFT_1912185 [Armillaria borealis]|uniref:Uncharacterized protein n=1 Tax=Armillaria borealis TaxID=47425 RepID=A0AA39IWF4_9AGAR|nr:hypothetical protein EV421DRAFT_1912185 [Armillaria borealis]
MRPFSSCMLIAKLAEATGVPYLENLAKAAIAVIELLEKVKTNKNRVKELAESIVNTVNVIKSHPVVGREGEKIAEHLADTCSEMERCLGDIAEHLNNEIRRHRGIRGFLDANDFRDAIESYKRQIDDLKTDFVIQLILDSLQMQYDSAAENRNKTGAVPRDEIVIHIPIHHARFAMLLFV